VVGKSDNDDFFRQLYRNNIVREALQDQSFCTDVRFWPVSGQPSSAVIMQTAKP
jgi:hypothetical protein